MRTGPADGGGDFSRGDDAQRRLDAHPAARPGNRHGFEPAVDGAGAGGREVGQQGDDRVQPQPARRGHGRDAQQVPDALKHIA